MHEQVSELLTAILERNGLVAGRPHQRLVHGHPRSAQRLPGGRRPQARHRRRAADLRAGAGHRGRHAAGRPVLAHVETDLPSPRSPTSTSAPRPPSARTSPSENRPRHRHRPDRHLRRARPRRPRRRRPPRRPRPGRRPVRRPRSAPARTRSRTGPVDLAIVAVPPAHVAATLADAQRRGRRPRLHRRGQRQGRAAPGAGGARLRPDPRTSARTRWRAGSSPGRWPPPPTSSRAGPGCSPPPGTPTPRCSTSRWSWSRSAAPCPW